MPLTAFEHATKLRGLAFDHLSVDLFKYLHDTIR